jgi:hypothetical protein
MCLRFRLLTAECFPLQVRVISFAQPPVGDAALRQLVRGAGWEGLFRTVDVPEDIIPRLLPQPRPRPAALAAQVAQASAAAAQAAEAAADAAEEAVHAAGAEPLARRARRRVAHLVPLVGMALRRGVVPAADAQEAFFPSPPVPCPADADASEPGVASSEASAPPAAGDDATSSSASAPQAWHRSALAAAQGGAARVAAALPPLALPEYHPFGVRQSLLPHALLPKAADDVTALGAGWRDWADAMRAQFLAHKMRSYRARVLALSRAALRLPPAPAEGSAAFVAAAEAAGPVPPLPFARIAPPVGPLRTAVALVPLALVPTPPQPQVRGRGPAGGVAPGAVAVRVEVRGVGLGLASRVRVRAASGPRGSDWRGAVEHASRAAATGGPGDVAPRLRRLARAGRCLRARLALPRDAVPFAAPAPSIGTSAATSSSLLLACGSDFEETVAIPLHFALRTIQLVDAGASLPPGALAQLARALIAADVTSPSPVVVTPAPAVPAAAVTPPAAMPAPPAQVVPPAPPPELPPSTAGRPLGAAGAAAARAAAAAKAAPPRAPGLPHLPPLPPMPSMDAPAAQLRAAASRAAAAAASLPRAWPFNASGPAPRDPDAEAEAAALAALSGEVCGRGVCIRWDSGEGGIMATNAAMPPLPRLRLAGGRIALPLPDPGAALRRAIPPALRRALRSGGAAVVAQPHALLLLSRPDAPGRGRARAAAADAAAAAAGRDVPIVLALLPRDDLASSSGTVTADDDVAAARAAAVAGLASLALRPEVALLLHASAPGAPGDARVMSPADTASAALRPAGGGEPARAWAAWGPGGGLAGLRRGAMGTAPAADAAAGTVPSAPAAPSRPIRLEEAPSAWGAAGAEAAGIAAVRAALQRVLLPRESATLLALADEGERPARAAAHAAAQAAAQAAQGVGARVADAVRMGRVAISEVAARRGGANGAAPPQPPRASL